MGRRLENRNLKLSTMAFTLIELLAVIVILAIIALIATPIILGIIEDTKRDAFLRSVELVVSTTDIDISNKTYTDSYTYTIIDGDISNLEVGLKNTKGMNGTIVYGIDGKEEYAIHNGNWCVRKYAGLENAEIKDYVEGMCVIPGQLTELTLGNYTFVDKEETYDGTEKKLEIENLPQGLTVEYPDGNTLKNVGEKEVKVIVHGNEIYKGTIEKTATLTITPANVTVTADNKTSAYGSSLETLTSTTIGTVYNNDDLNITLTKEEGSNFGKYKITVSASNPNYNITKNDGTYTITRPVLDTLKAQVSSSGKTVSSGNGQLSNLGNYGIRYQGFNPNNYVYFNCSDYNNPTTETCELWRIIGVVDGSVKLLKSTSIGDFSWDTGDVNNWSKASLNTYLNGTYLTSITSKNSVSGDMIKASTWYLRSKPTTEFPKAQIYTSERQGLLYGSNPSAVSNKKIGLMYASDWAYAAIETTECTSSTILYDYNTCKSTDWIVQGLDGYEWLLNPRSSDANGAFYGYKSGVVRSATTSKLSNEVAVRPTFYLVSTVKLADGDGSIEEPFTIIP